jgi:hypothetical protein
MHALAGAGRRRRGATDVQRAYLMISPLAPMALRVTVLRTYLSKSVVLYMESSRSTSSRAEMKGLDLVSGRRARQTLMDLPCACATISK